MYHLDIRWFTDFVATARPRHQVTETPAVARAIDRAAVRWPGEPRSKLLLLLLLRRLLVGIGSETSEHQDELDVEAHRAAVTASSGAYPDALPPDYLAALREDWPP
ncbi:MAG: hypothetical protein M0Z69_14745 [Actinomycetota bacterium]|nr:hypothetical protein [Actinomycetota bacterium]